MWFSLFAIMATSSCHKSVPNPRRTLYHQVPWFRVFVACIPNISRIHRCRALSNCPMHEVDLGVFVLQSWNPGPVVSAVIPSGTHAASPISTL